MIFVCGIHGVGKTHYCKTLSKELELPYFIASDLLEKRKKQVYIEKRVQNIRENQEILIEAVKKIEQQIRNYILDGHLCLLDAKNKIKKIPIEVFAELNIENLVVLIDGEKEIQKRLLERDGINWSCEFIKTFQEEEIEYAKKIAKELNIDLKIIKNMSGLEGEFNNNIILPIKPVYAEQILSNEKKYEFRRILCKENIDKIYLYATSPVMAVVGEAQVIEKIIMKKDRMWQIVKEEAGIQAPYYYKYFDNKEYACAYRLGNVKKYKKWKLLKDIGITYMPQSYVYIKSELFCDSSVECYS